VEHNAFLGIELLSLPRQASSMQTPPSLYLNAQLRKRPRTEIQLVVVPANRMGLVVDNAWRVEPAKFDPAGKWMVMAR